MAEEAKKSKVQMVGKNWGRFFKDIRNELKKVIWPNRAQLINNTLSVLLTCVFIGAIIWIVDGGIGYVREWLYNVK